MTSADKVVVPWSEQLDAFNEQAGGDPDPGAAPPESQACTRGPKTKPGSLGFDLRRQSETVYRTADRLKQAADKYKSEVEYPDGELGPQLRRAAQIIAGRMGVRVLFASQDGYDTHASARREYHANLLGELSATELAAFERRDLAKRRATADQVLVMAFSEFGRRVDENASKGTDHGATSSNLLLVGSKVQAGLVGKYPSLAKLGEGDLVYGTDFRSDLRHPPRPTG